MQTHDINGEMASYTAAEQQKQVISHKRQGFSGFKSSLINVGLTMGELLLLLGGDDFTNLGRGSQPAQGVNPAISSSLD
ncbi:MAG: hypothetical protein ABL903_01765 [Methylococcales bacterium]